jgi:maltooligosyltrehalose trehalohydrolase
MLFQGQEFGATNPFMYFADASADLREAIQKGRFEFLSQFPSAGTPEVQAQLPQPSDPATFKRSKLDFAEREKFPALAQLHRDLLRLRRDDSRFSQQTPQAVDGAVLGHDSFVLRFFGEENDDRLIVVNLGPRCVLAPTPEPLLAPPLGFEWETLWTSEAARYGGPGACEVATDQSWTIPAEATVALRPVRETKPRRKPKKRGSTK